MVKVEPRRLQRGAQLAISPLDLRSISALSPLYLPRLQRGAQLVIVEPTAAVDVETIEGRAHLG